MRKYYPFLVALLSLSAKPQECSLEHETQRHALLDSIYAKQTQCRDTDGNPHRVTIAEQHCLVQLLPKLPTPYDINHPLPPPLTNNQLEEILTQISKP